MSERCPSAAVDPRQAFEDIARRQVPAARSTQTYLRLSRRLAAATAAEQFLDHSPKRQESEDDELPELGEEPALDQRHPGTAGDESSQSILGNLVTAW